MTITLDGLFFIKLFAVACCLLIGGGLSYLWFWALQISESQRGLLWTFLLLTVSATGYAVYFITTYQV
jgi:hypothetical protein